MVAKFNTPVRLPIYAADVVRLAADPADENQFIATIACETPFDRWFGRLQLDCNDDAVDLGRMNNLAPLLVGHNHDNVAGVFDAAWVENRRVFGRGRWSRTARAQDVRMDVQDRIRAHVSPGVWIHELILVEDKEGEPPLYRATKWEIEEASIVAVAAMDELSIAASGEEQSDPWRSDGMKSMLARARGGDVMNKNQEGVAPVHIEAAAEQVETTQAPAPAAQAVMVGRDLGDQQERRENARQARIRAIAERLGSDMATVNKAISAEMSSDDFMLQELDRRQQAKPTAAAEDIVGMTDDETTRRFSLVKLAAYASASQEQRRKMLMEREGSGPSIGLTLEACAAAAQKRVNVRGEYSLPGEVLRAANLTEPSEGGFLKDRRRGSMIDLLSASTKVLALGAYPLGDLVGDVDMPRIDAGLTGYVLEEDEDATESNLSYGLLTLRAKTVGANAYMTRSFVKQTSYDAEMLYRTHLALAISLKMDSLAITGIGGRTQPIGILNTTGIGAVVGGTDGLAPAWSHIVKLETEVDQDNALVGRCGYLTNAKMRGSLKRTAQHATAPVAGWIWQPYPGETDPTIGMLNGYPAHVSNQVPGNLTKGSGVGVCSAIIFGNWNDALIATWGGIDLAVDPYSKSKRGGIVLTALFDYDFAILRPSSFSAMQDALEAA